MAKICVPVCVRRVEELPDAVDLAARAGDVVEIRLDCLSEAELKSVLVELKKTIDHAKSSLILTLRPAEEGGERAITIEDRLFFRIHNSFLARSEEPIDYWDEELDLALLLQQRQTEGNDVTAWGLLNWEQAICSHHDFVGVPADLEQLYERMARTPAAVIKIAVQADDAIDCLPIFRLLERARREDRHLIAIAMGAAGIMTRILGPSRGSFLTYGSLDEENVTAPGQVTAKDLRELYRIDRIDSRTEIFGIIGKPVGHSLSPRIHNAAFAAAGMNAVYIPMEVQDVASFMRRMAHPKTRELDWNLGGLSVTAPHKSTVIQYLDWVDPAAKEIGAVNTIVVRDDQLFGYNTDAEGFISPLRAKLGDLRDARCAVIGSGGAARAVLWALRNAGAQATLVARNRERANDLAQRFKATCPPQPPERFNDFDVIINATPMGTRGPTVNETPATAAQLRGVRLAYDLVYNPSETRFLSEAREAGCDTVGGIEMLLAQAAEQFKFWTGSEPDKDVMRVAATKALTD